MMKTSPVILLIDDNEQDQYVAVHYLRRAMPGVEIVIAFDGSEAIEVLESRLDNLPDLILLDINMPRMNGHEFLQEWSDRTGLDIPVVVMLTSSSQEVDRQKALGFDNVRDYLVKPMRKSTASKLAESLYGTPGAGNDTRPSEPE